MPAIANTVVTTDRRLVRENVRNMIFNIDPMQTPCLSSLRRRGTKQIIFETPTDSYADPVDQAVPQGDDITSYDVAPSPVKHKGYTQLMDKAILISDTARKQSYYGYSDELNYQVGKKSVELKRDMEKRLTGNYPSVKPAGGAPTTKTGSMASWIETNFKSLKVTPTTPAAPGGYNTTTENTEAATVAQGGTFGKYVEQDVRDMLVGMFEHQDMIGISQILFSPKNKERTSRVLVGKAEFRKDYGKSRSSMVAVNSIDLYKSDFGLHRLMINRWQPANFIYFNDPRYWAFREFQPFQILPLARTGHAVKRLLKVEFGLECKHEAANGLIVDASNGGT